MSDSAPIPAAPARAMRAMGAVREALLLWAISFTAILAAVLVLPAHANAVATLAFLYLPLLSMRRRGEDYQHLGVSLRRWRDDLRAFALVSLAVLPLFAAGFFALVKLLPYLPPALGPVLFPGSSARPVFHLRWPEPFGILVLEQLLAVALPEELFYRGYLQSRLRDAWPQGRVFLGVRWGPAFWVTAALFALGHLAIFQAGRLAVFFPALLFGWLRERTGTVVGATLFHAACNLLIATLEFSIV